jgi:hypothetical protein
VPAAAVIPAPIAYIKVVAVKKLVVGFLVLFFVLVHRKVSTGRTSHPSGVCVCTLLCVRFKLWNLYFEKIRVFKAGIRLNTLAWNNGIGLWFYFVGF